MLYRVFVQEDTAELHAVNENTAGSTLTGLNRKVYENLRHDILLIAAGKKPGSVIVLDLNALGFDTITYDDGTVTSTMWTAEELGAKDENDDGKITLADAKVPLANKLLFDSSLVIDALRSDCPYELYWYDITEGVSQNTSIAYTSRRDGEVLKFGFNSDTKIAFSFTVSSEYAPEEISGGYTIDIEKISSNSVSTAVENAQRIVESQADKSDYEKLIAYKGAICDSVTYNCEAANSDSLPYGNPWQLVWVFDGDDGTNVVCEGYAKAFQYLCDISNFHSNNQCWSVSGTMDGMGHMWNILQMPDGKKYHVDITNCDDNSIGFPDYFF